MRARLLEWEWGKGTEASDTYPIVGVGVGKGNGSE